MNQVISQELTDICKKKLIQMRQDLMNRARTLRSDFTANEKSTGDEIDQAVAYLAEHHFLVSQDRLRHQLLEINYALSRIENGRFGICEETDEPIETERLLALPFTRLSIEGAEIRETAERRFART